MGRLAEEGLLLVWMVWLCSSTMGRKATGQRRRDTRMHEWGAEFQ